MKFCTFRATDRIHRTGRRIAECTICGKIGLVPFSGNLGNLHSNCDSWPQWYEIGSWTAIIMEALWIPKWFCGGGCGQRASSMDWAGFRFAAWLGKLIKEPTNANRP